MIISFGDTSQFGDLCWYMVEFRSEKTIESTLRRLGQAIDKIFRDTAVEIFIPIQKRDLHSLVLSTGNIIYARCPKFQCLLQMKSVTGVVGLITLGDTRHASRAIKVEHSYVQGIIDKAEMEFQARAEEITVNSFVRIIDGEMRDWCGTVTDIHDGIAAVRVELKTKIMLVETPVRNLLDKSFVPAELRVFYYGEIVEDLTHTQMEGLIAEDIHFEPEEAAAIDGLDSVPPVKHGRQQTVTALVKRLIVTGTLQPTVIGTVVLAALRAGDLKMPKNLSIIHGIIKSRLIEDHFIHLDPTIVNYREVVERFGSDYKFSVQDLARLDPEIGIPLTSDERKPA